VRIKLVLAVAVIATLTASILPGIASAHDFRVKPKVNLQLLPDNPVDDGQRVALAGKIKGKNFCANRRQVELFRRDGGRDTLLDTDRSDGDGEFRFRVAANSDMVVYAKVGRLTDRNYNHRHVCRRSKSEAVTINVAG